MFDPRSPKVQPQLVAEQKSYSDGYTGVGQAMSFPEYLAMHGQHDLSAFAAISLYQQCMPLFNAISLRAELMAQIQPRVRDKRTKEFIDDHPILELLNQPNADVSKVEFFEQLASYYDITGECFVVATGRIISPPLELLSIAPQFLQFGEVSSRFGLLNIPAAMRITQVNQGQISFNVDDYRNLGIRYVRREGDAEIWHIRSFNPLRSSSNFRGMSRAKALWFEIQQYISGNVTNLAFLKRGTRISMAWVNATGKPLTDTQWTRMTALAQQYSGDQNSGGTPILDGMDIKPIQQTNKDMQFQELQKEMLARISTLYRVPLALLLTDSMTLDNLKTSYLQLFDGGVLPLASRIYSELTRMLMPRYPGSENYELTYSEHDISALRERTVDIAKKMKDVDVHTINELRHVLGDKPIEDGGDEIYRPAGLIAVGEDDVLMDDNVFDDVEPTTTPIVEDGAE